MNEEKKEYCLDVSWIPEELYEAIVDECYRQWGATPGELIPEDLMWRLSFRNYSEEPSNIPPDDENSPR